MDTGLMITEKEFMSLPQKKRDCLLYQNQVTTIDLIRGYKFNQKIQYFLSAACLAGVGILFKLQLGI